MSRSLSSFVSMFCLLVLLISSAACLALPQNALTTQLHPMVNTPEHACCPQRSAAGEHASTACCTVHHQPVSAVSVVELEQPAVLPHALTVAVLVAATVYPPANQKLGRPQPPPSVALRI
jgi:hypothetical protein